MSGKPIVNFDNYINRVLKDVHFNIQLSENARSQICSFLCTVGTKVAQEATFLANTKFGKSKEDSKLRTLTARDIQNAVILVIPGELAKFGVSAGTKAVTRFVSSGRGTKQNPVPATRRAGIIFPPSLAEKIIRNNHCGKVGSTASVYLAAVLEYLCAEVLELSGNAVRDMNSSRITARSIATAIELDAEINQLIHDMNWEVIGGGKIPNIYAVLLPKKKISNLI